MRQPSRSARERLRAIGAADPDQAAALLRALAQDGEPALVAGLLPHVLHREPQVGVAARDAARALLQRAAPTDLLALEQQLRGRSDAWWHGAGAWSELRPVELPALSTQPGGEVLVVLASCHHSGFVREAAVRLLSTTQDGSEVPWLLLRLNDWVGPVRFLAHGALVARLRPDCAPAFAAHLPLVEQLAVYRRHDHAAILGRITALLRHPACRPALLDGLRAPDRRVRRGLYRLATEAEGIDLRALLLQALRDDDLPIRLWAARTARARLYGRALAEALGQARRDRSVPVRREAVSAFLDDFPELREVLLDPCSSIREMARFYIRKKAHLDFAALYRDEIAGDTGRRWIALQALGEVGGKDDAQAALPYAGPEHPVRVRKAALQALGRLSGEAHLPLLLAALADAHRGVSRVARDALRPHLPGVVVDGLQALTGAGHLPHVRLHALWLLARSPVAGRWRRLAALLRACEDADAEVAKLARTELARWLGAASYLPPTPAERLEVRAALDQLRDRPLCAQVERALWGLA
jgi:HEAT repeat protein